MDEYEEPEKDGELAGNAGANLEKILKVLLDYAAEKGLLQENSVVYRDLFDTKLMNCLMPRPSEVNKDVLGEISGFAGERPPITTTT